MASLKKHLIAVLFGAAVLLGLAAFAQRATAADAPKPDAEGFVALFNGKDLTGWEGNPDLWSVRDGAIRGETTRLKPTKGNTFLIWRDGKVKDFEMRLSFRMNSGNSGIQYRSVDKNNWVVSGYQFEVANEPGRAGFLYHEKGRGRICLCSEKVVMDEQAKKQVVGAVGTMEEIKKAFRLGEWNDVRIVAEGNHITHFINGVQTIDFTDNDAKGRLMEGIVALQIHAGAPMWVEFKDIRVKTLGGE